MRKLIFIGIMCLAGVLLNACSKGVVYSRFHPIPSEEWHMDSVVRFDYAITDTATDYRVLVYVRHTERYPYQNMWLFLGDSTHRDTIEFYLADDRGQWLGDRRHGFIEMPVLYGESVHYPDTGFYYMEIVHGMRDSLLRGVMDVGMEVVKN
ncbi:MAG: gliding motility lipoprotein GldH [Paludibacteraceae bacterium]|nr:gliding motility lipoprotein GldH [Paludibacteraceae bacterium]MBQ7996103.1 gliding motility lipoprotein GldH [Paludibacteraceae bacterium]